MSNKLHRIQNNKVRAIVMEVLDNLERKLGAYINYSDSNSASIKFESAPSLGTLRISTEACDDKYIPRWNIFVYPASERSSYCSRTTHWYSEEEVAECMKHINNYANALESKAQEADKLADIVARKQALQEQQVASSQETYEAYANMDIGELSNLSQDVIDQYQDDPDYLEYLNKQAGEKKDGYSNN